MAGNHQIRFLQAKISTVDLRFDPVEILPFELCNQVFQHLEVYQIFQAQRVSRKWSQILSSPQIVEPLALRPWFGNSDISSRTSKALLRRALTLPDGQASFQARHIDSFRNGTAFSMRIDKWKKEMYGDVFPSYIDFAGSILAWAYQRTGFIQLKCLVSGQRVSLFTPTREEVGQIAISEKTIVAMTLSGNCCAWDLSMGIRTVGGQSPKCIETHAVHVKNFVVSGSTVAILHDSDEEMMSITTWDFKRRQSHQFRIGINKGAFSELYSYFVIVTSDEKSVVFFERVFDESAYVCYTKMDLKGQIQSSGCMEHPNIEDYTLHSETRTRAYTTGYVTLWSYAGRRQEPDAQQAKLAPWEVLRVCYDMEAGRLELQRHTVESSIRTRFGTRKFLWWKDVAYFESYAGGPGELEVLDLKASVCKKAEMSASTLIPETLKHFMAEEDDVWYSDFDDPGPSQPPDSLLLGNESFLLIARAGYYIGWCFEDIKLAGEHKEYRAMMMEKKKQRFKGKNQRER